MKDEKNQSSLAIPAEAKYQKWESHHDAKEIDTLKEKDNSILEFVTVRKWKAGHNQMQKRTSRKYMFLKYVKNMCIIVS